MLTISFVFLVFLTFTTLTAVGCNVVIPIVLKAIAPINPEARAHLLFLVAAAPWLVAGSVLVSSLGDLTFGGCEAGTACLWTEDPTLIGPIRVFVAVPIAIAIVIAIFFAVIELIRARRIVQTFENASTTLDPDGFYVVPSERGFAFSGYGRIFVSSGLKDKLAPEHLQAVTLHEKAHVERRDGFVQFLASMLSTCYVPPLRRRLLTALALANEQSCDLRAASVVGANNVAGAILAAERMKGEPVTLISLHAFADCFVATRIDRLTTTVSRSWSGDRLRLVILVSALSAFLACDTIYYLTMLILFR